MGAKEVQPMYLDRGGDCMRELAVVALCRVRSRCLVLSSLDLVAGQPGLLATVQYYVLFELWA